MRAHRTDFLSLAFALVFGVFVTWWAIAQIVDVELPAAGWFISGGLILFGLLGLLGALRSGRGEPERAPDAVHLAAAAVWPADVVTEPHADADADAESDTDGDVESDADVTDTLPRDGDRP
jgi:hypothetical protein